MGQRAATAEQLPESAGNPRQSLAPAQDAGSATRGAAVSVVIPALNEARNIGRVLTGLPASVDEVIVVDGRSVDGTAEAARAARPGILVVEQSRRGKGNALAAGFAAASGDYIVMIDADGSMDPAEIERFVSALESGADYVKGSRFIGDGGSDDISALRRLGNNALNGLTNLLFRTCFTDLCYGYNAFRQECLVSLALPDPHGQNGSMWGDGFEIETLINVRAAKAGFAITEVPSYEHPRVYGESHLHTFRDGARVLATIVREYVDRNGAGRDRKRVKLPSRWRLARPVRHHPITDPRASAQFPTG